MEMKNLVTNHSDKYEIVQHQDDDLKIVLKGDWLLKDGLSSVDNFETELTNKSTIKNILFSSGSLGQWDTSLIQFARSVVVLCKQNEVNCDLSDLPEGVQNLVKLSTAVPERTDTVDKDFDDSLLSRFYTLTSISAGEISAQESTKREDITVGVGVVDFPEYLERPQIVTHVTDNELAFAEYERWAEPLKDNFTSVLLQNLSLLVPTDKIYMVPWKDYDTGTYQIILEIVNFERQADKIVYFSVRWSVLYGDSKNFLLKKKSEYREPIANDSYGEIVKAMSRAVGSLSEEIAAEIKRVAQ